MNGANRYLWVHIGTLAESLPALPLFSALAGQVSGANLFVLAREEFTWLYDHHPGVAEVIPLNIDRALVNKHYQDKLLARLLELEADWAINAMLNRSLLADLVTLGSEAPNRIAFRLQPAGLLAGEPGEADFYTHLVESPSDLAHFDESALDFLRVIGLPAHLPRPVIRVEPGKVDTATRTLAEAGGANLVDVRSVATTEAEPLPGPRQEARPLKVALLSHSDSGGAGIAAYRLHRGLRERGVESTMLVLVKESGDPTVRVLPAFDGREEVVPALDQDPEQTAWKQTFRRWRANMEPYPHRPQGLERLTDAAANARVDLIREVREADVVNLHWIAGLLDYRTAGRVLAEKPLVWTLHDLHAFTGGCHYSAGCLKYRERCGACPALGSNEENDLSRIVWETKRNFYNRADVHVVGLSRWLKGEAEASALFGRFPSHLIPNGIPLDTYHPSPQMECRREFGIGDGDDVILFGAEAVDNLRKGFEFMPKALGALESRLEPGRAVTLATFGRTPPAVELPARFNLVHVGAVQDPARLARLYSAADVFVIPSLEDNLPNTVLEALACGTPVAGFAIGGIPDMIEHQSTGFIATPFEPDSLADGILWAIDGKKSDPGLRERCRAVTEAKYSVQRQAGDYVELFEKLTGRR